MKQFKITILTCLFTIGFIFPGCEKDSLDSCSGIKFLHFFDVQGVELDLISDFTQRTSIPASDTVKYEELEAVYVDYVVNYVASIQARKRWTSSLMSSAYGCSYVNGTMGSKKERLSGLTITTIHEFDQTHLAGSSINDILNYTGHAGRKLNEIVSLVQYLNEQSDEMEEEDLALTLTKAPDSARDFQLKVSVSLSTGEVYEALSPPIFLVP